MVGQDKSDDQRRQIRVVPPGEALHYARPRAPARRGWGGFTFHKTELAWWRRSGEGRSGVWDAAEGADVAFQEELEGSRRESEVG